MKALAFVLFLAAAAEAIAQAAPAKLIVDTSQWKDGQSYETMLDNSVRVTIRREGEVRRVTASRLGITNEYRIEPVDGVLTVTSVRTEPFVVISPHRITVDGLNMDGSQDGVPGSANRRRALFYICPKDDTILRIPHSNHDGDFRCPVDGTPMRPSAGPASPYFLLR